MANGDYEGRARLLDCAAAGEYLSVSPATVRAWIRQGRLPCVRLGRRVLLDRRALDRLIDRSGDEVREDAA